MLLSDYLMAQDKFNKAILERVEELNSVVGALLEHLGLEAVENPKSIVVEKKKKGGGK